MLEFSLVRVSGVSKVEFLSHFDSKKKIFFCKKRVLRLKGITEKCMGSYGLRWLGLAIKLSQVVLKHITVV